MEDHSLGKNVNLSGVILVDPVIVQALVKATGDQASRRTHS